MRWRVGKLGGTELWLHGATLICWLYVLLQGQGALLGTGLASIALHECAHGVAAALFRMPPRQAEITPLGLLLRLEEEARLPPLRRAVMLLAGPAATAALALLGWYGTQWRWLPASVGARLFFMNLGLLLLNLLPALPMDGGRLLALGLSLRLDLAAQGKVMRAAGTAVGLGLTGLAVAGGLLWGGMNFSLAAAGCFALYAAQAGTVTEALTVLRDFLDRRNRLEIRGVMRGEVLTALEHQPLRSVLPRLRQERYTFLAVLERGTLRVLGVADEDALQRAYLQRPDASCSDALGYAPEWLKARPNQHVDK